MQLKIDTVKEVKAVDFIDDVFVNTSTFKTSLLSMAEIKRNEILNAKKAKDVLDKDRTDKAYINMIFLSCIFGVTAAIKFFSGFAFFDIFMVFSYITGLLIGVKSGLKLKEHNDTMGEVPLSISVKLMLLSSFLIVLPFVMSN